MENMKRTTNGGAAYSSLNNACLNMFARIGGMRKSSEDEIVALYRAARNEDVTLADNMVLYCRNIREGGLGERRIGRILLNCLAKLDKEKIFRNLDTIVAAGRWDDVIALRKSFSNKEDIYEIDKFLASQLKRDGEAMRKGKPVSLLAKWMPSVNTSSRETVALAREFCKSFGLSEKRYRKILSSLRKYLKVLETKMSAREFAEIDYATVPSLAMTKYRRAFGRRDYERFSEYLESVAKGESKINSGVSYPYELIRPYTAHSWRIPDVDLTLELQWKSLPNYVEGNHNVIIMPDVSGSMSGVPMDVSVSLGIYFAERNTGAYKDFVVTFTDKPYFYKLNSKDTLRDKVRKIMENVGYNTNLDGAFEAIYRMSIQAGAAPTALVVISDMEIDRYIRSHNVNDVVEKWQKKYAEVGLVAPKLIMWNVAASSNATYLGKATNPGVSFVSGSSASTFRELNKLITLDAYKAMVEILTQAQFCWR